MSYQVIFTKNADLDILTTTYWYNDQQTGLYKIILLAVLHAKRNPNLWVERKLYE